jgi:hypothetical protein
MSPSEPIATRKLVVDTGTPGTEIFIIDAEGRVVERGIRKIETELPLALYKIRCRVGDRVADSLIELEAGSGPYLAPKPELPIFSPAPPIPSPGAPPDQSTDFAHALLDGPRVDRGFGSSLFIFVTADRLPNTSPPANPAAALSIRKFSGELVAELTDAQTQSGCAGCAYNLDPGRYLLRSALDAGAPVEQAIVVAPGWQTRIYIRLVVSKIPSSSEPTTDWKLDLPQMGIVMIRDFPGAGLGLDDTRWTTAARLALAARRSEAAPNRDMMAALLRGKFDNPMWGIYAGHLLAMQKEPDLQLLREVYSNLSALVGPHPDVDALLIALGDPKAKDLTYPEPPMLYASWALVLRASTTQHDLRPERSYSARIAASLWGTGAWLSWRMPPAETTTVQSSPELLQALIDEASAGRLEPRLQNLAKRKEELSPVERLLASQLMAMSKRLQFANELTADDDNSTFPGSQYVFPVYRLLVDSHLQKQTKQKIAIELSPEKLSDWSGIPHSTMLEAASTLGHKLGLPSASLGTRILANTPFVNRTRFGRS